VLHEFVDLYGVMIFVIAVDGKTDGTDESSIFAIGVDADEGGILSMRMAIVRLDEILEALCKLLRICFYRHKQ
jgi:hypothetical protein